MVCCCADSPIGSFVCTTPAFKVSDEPCASLVSVTDARQRLEGYVLRSTFSSHSQWIPSVMWSRTNEHLFVSGSYDTLVKLWDTRSLKAPLYDLQGHDDRVLCVDWSVDQLILSGGADHSLKMFSFHK
jgi:WD40 repeat protein